MRYHYFFSAAALLSTFFVQTAYAQDAETTDDIRCVIVTTQLQSSPDERVRSAAVPAGLYFFGRLDGHAPNLDLEKEMTAELLKMTSEEFRSEAKRCGSELTTRGQVLTIVGEHLLERGKKMLQQDNSKNP